MELVVIAAVDNHGGIGLNGGIPWAAESYTRDDMKYFSTMTRQGDKAVIMGRLTYESIPEKFKPLPGRINIVISSAHTNDTTTGKVPRFVPVNSFEAALEWCASNGIARPAVIGGARVYEAALKHPGCAEIHLTRVPYGGPTDTRFPVELLAGFTMTAGKLPGSSVLSLEIYKRAAAGGAGGTNV